MDKAAARVSARLGKAGFEEAMLAALAAEDVLAADETPVNVLGKAPPPAPAAGRGGEADPEEKDGRRRRGAARADRPHPGRAADVPAGHRLAAQGQRRRGGIPAAFTGHLITDGYTGYQHLLSRLAGIQQCCPHVIRRCRAVTKLGPGGLQSWAGDVIAILREAHQAVEARPRPRRHRPGPAGPR